MEKDMRIFIAKLLCVRSGAVMMYEPGCERAWYTGHDDARPNNIMIDFTHNSDIEAETKLPLFRIRNFQMHKQCTFLTENVWISLRISMKFVPKVRINSISAFVQIMALRRPGDKPLSEPIMVSALTHIFVTRY